MEIDVFWSFRSRWSYLATRRLRDWQEQYQLQVNFRVVDDADRLDVLLWRLNKAGLQTRHSG